MRHSTLTSRTRLRVSAIAVLAVAALAAPLVIAAPVAAAPPGAATLVAPANGSVSADADPRLSVRATDPDGDPVTVRFEGREKGATVPGGSTAEPFTLVAIPDIQNYTSAARAPIIAQQAQWVVNNRASMNTQFVVQLGDLVSDWSRPQHWPFASTGLEVLDDAGMPNAVVAGNHDFDEDTGAHVEYDQWFPPSRYHDATWTPATATYGGYMGQDQFGDDPVDRGNMNNYSLFTAGGIDWLVLGLEWEAPTASLEWADRVLAAHPDRTVIMFTHAFLNLPGSRRTFAQRPGGTPPETIWQDFVRTHCQVRFVLNGHEHAGDLGESRRTDANACGQPVHQLLSNYQDRINGGNGWLRYYEFAPASNTVTARTYSPYLQQFETDADSTFTLPYEFAPSQPAPFEPIASVSVPSGQIAATTWTGLARDTEYEWRAVIDDGTSTTTSATWTVRTPTEDVLLRDGFSRVRSSGWGSADTGQAWTSGSTSSLSVDGAVGRFVISPSARRDVTPTGVVAGDAGILTSFAMTPAATGSGTYASLWSRRSTGGDYRAMVTFRTSGGAPNISLSRKVGSTETTLATFRMPVAPAVGQPVNLRYETEGSSPTTLRVKAWLGSTEPTAWTLTATDATSALQTASGGIGISGYTSGTATGPSTLLIDAITVARLGAAPPATNAPPVAMIAVTNQNERTVSFSGTGSTDGDGSIAGYAWSFGDGTTATGPTPTRTYTADGTYTVTLGVTDDDGATHSTSRTVTVAATPPPPNTPPVAVIAVTGQSGRTVSFSGSGSTDADGTITSSAWALGDGTTASGTTATRTYTADGTYTVTLTVTDDDGATHAATRTITVAATPPPTATIASDAFGRTLATGWGAADVGGAWTLQGSAAQYSVGSGAGSHTVATAGGSTQTTLNAVSAQNVELRSDVSWNRSSAQGDLWTGFVTRSVASSDYRFKVYVGSTGKPRLDLARRISGAETKLASVTLSTFVIAPGTRYTAVARFVTVGGTTTLQAKLFPVGTAEPAWQITTADATASLQAPGRAAFWTYRSSSSTAAITTTFDNFSVTAITP